MGAVEESGDRGRAHRRLRRQDDVTRGRRRPSGEFQCRGDGIGGDFQHQPVTFGSDRIKLHAEQQCRACGLRSDCSLQHPGGAASRVNPELLKPRVEHGVWSRDADIGCQRQIHPRTDGCSIDCGDRRQRATAQRHEAFIELLESILGRSSERGQIGTRAERLTRAGDHGGMNFRIGFGLFHRHSKLIRPGRSDGVSPLRVVDSDEGDTVNDVVEKHGPRLAGNIRSTFLGVIGESDPMKTMTVIAAGSALALSLTLAGCGADKKAETSSSAPTSASTTATSTNIAMPSERPKLEGANKTINDYIVENKIAETPFKPDEPGTPNFDFPFPPDWSPAGDKTPAWAYGAIVYDKPQDAADPPTIIAIASKLTGNIDAAKVLEYAPGAIQNLPEYQSVYEPNKTTLGGFEAIQSAGTFVEEGKKRVVAQKTVVVPGKDALFVLQLNAVAPDGQQGVILDAAKLIDEQTKITP